MIPESGTRSELQKACLSALAQPLLGEVYAWVDGDNFRECWRVTEIKPELRKALIDVYHTCHDGRMHRSLCGSSVNLSEWALCILNGTVRYVGMRVPSEVIVWR